MAKASGNMRQGVGGGASSPIPPATQRDYYTEEEERAIIDKIAKGGYVNFEEYGHIWTDIMNKEQRELMLMQAGFTGMISDDELDTIGTIYVPATKKDLVNELLDDLRNEGEGYSMDDSTYWTIGYVDGTRRYVSMGESDIDLSGVKVTNLSRTNEEKLRSRLNLSNIAYIIKTDGYDEPRYYVKSGEEYLLRKYGNFEFWKNGRGEKRRNYIQDDWI